MKSNILFIIPDKQEQAVLTAQLQAAYTIHVADSITGIEKIIGEENIQLVVCSRDIFDASIPKPIKTPQTDDEFVRTLQECISANIRSKLLSVDWLAKVMNMSRPTLYRKIKNLTGQTPNELIGSARLQQAAILIASANYKIFEVAEMVGFGSSSSFSKAFFKKFKATPIAYQRMKKNGGMHS